MEEITADNMRELATTSGNEIRDILYQIKQAAKKGETRLYLSDYRIKDITILLLEKRGFKIQIGGRYNEVNTLIIWD